MNSLLRLAAALFAAVALQAGAQKNVDWETLQPEDGSFTALMPGHPEYQKAIRDSLMAGEYTLHVYTCRIEGVVYRLGYNAYPPGPAIDPETELQANRDNFIEGISGRLIRSIAIRLQGVPGIDFTAENERLRIRSRVYFLDQRAIQLIVAVPKGREEPANINRFLESLRFSNRD
ncbi:MAG: hypothetical protein ACREUQ_07560 [Burkholderiales bacterium]